ncbi:hypothetical protein SRB5_36980 [Streptomyces sp. RB5]|uniref:Uncharacterized protein n=1 Tax=Streptomyces smaragdinus TaxID=2585196 RepID=A0A7K0CJ95_9ACTN|nr:hypothetical protein [Streptomyces smaragdinus]MQY13550.1 hypothetical protein [Streptomyces smaragdinus]
MNDEQSAAPARHHAGALDIRSVIAGLIGCYGIVLTVMGLVSDSAADRVKTGDVNANLWAGLGMIAAAALFALWAYLRPLGRAPAPGDADRD